MKMKNKEKAYCYHCDKMVDFEIKEINENTKVSEKGIPVNVKVKRAYCKHCGTVVPYKKIDYEADRLVYDEYKRKVGLLTSQEIKEIRLLRNLSQRELSLMLGLGEKTITRYENGAIQDRAYDILLRLIKDNRGYRLIKKINKASKQKENINEEQLFQAINEYIAFHNQNSKIKVDEVTIKYKYKNSIKLKKLIAN